MACKGLLPWPDSPVAYGKTAAHTPADAAVVGSGAAGQGELTEWKEEHKVFSEKAHVGDEVRIASVGGVAMNVPPCSFACDNAANVCMLALQEFVRHPKFSAVANRPGGARMDFTSLAYAALNTQHTPLSVSASSRELVPAHCHHLDYLHVHTTHLPLLKAFSIFAEQFITIHGSKHFDMKVMPRE